MKFSSKLRGRTSPHIFTRGSKAATNEKAQLTKKEPSSTKSVSKAAAHFNSETVKDATEEALVNKAHIDDISVVDAPAHEEAPTEEAINEAQGEPFPDIHADAREDDDDSFSIQTEQREDIMSTDSIKTEYDEPQEVRDGAGDVEETACKQDPNDVAKVSEESKTEDMKTTEEKVELSIPAAEGCRASCVLGMSHIQPPNMDKPRAVMKECKETLSKKFDEARPGLELSLAKVGERANDMRSSLTQLSTKAGTSIAAGAATVSTRAGESIANVSTRAGGVAKRFVCGDERALQYHAKMQEQVISPKQDIPFPVAAAAAAASPTKAALGKYTLKKLVCGSYKCSDCVHDLAVGAVDILCLGYCDCDNHSSENELPDALSPTALSPNTYGDSTARAFTFDSMDSCDYTLPTDAPNLNMSHNLSKAAAVSESTAIMLQSVELTEGEFNQLKNMSTTTEEKIMTSNDKGKRLISFTPRSSRGRKSPFLFSQTAATPKASMKALADPIDATENVAIELIGESLTPRPQNSRRKSFFRRGDKESSKFRVQTVIDGEQSGSKHDMVKSASSTASDSQKTGSTGGSTTKVKNSNGIALALKNTRKRRSKGGSNEDECSEESGHSVGGKSMYSL